VGVRVNKPWSHDRTAGIDSLCCRAINVAHLYYLAVCDGDASLPGWTASAIDQCSILDKDVVFHWILLVNEYAATRRKSLYDSSTPTTASGSMVNVTQIPDNLFKFVRIKGVA
jgi:hypothetical protein